MKKIEEKTKSTTINKASDIEKLEDCFSSSNLNKSNQFTKVLSETDYSKIFSYERILQEQVLSFNTINFEEKRKRLDCNHNKIFPNEKDNRC